MAVIPLGITRISNALLLDRSMLIAQNQQAILARYEQQITSEQRYQYGSDAPFDAATSLSVQTQMERKAQNATNLLTTQSYLTATDSTLSQVNTMLTEARSMGLEAISTTTSSTQRQALAQSVKQTAQKIFDFGNYQFRDRYVFSGATTTVKPFVWGQDSYSVNYNGSTANLYSWSDLDLLSQSNQNGAEVFGAISAPVKGSVDLNPSIAGSTLLSSLNNGKGVQSGSVRITYSGSDGTRESLVDLSQCVTIDDVRNALAKQAPTGTTIKLGLGGNALTVEMASTVPDGSITITEVGNGMTAHQLGLYSKTPIASGSTFVGADINPKVSRSTPLDSLLGTPAQSVIRFSGNDNDLVIQSKFNGDTYKDANGKTWPLNGVKIELQSDSQTAVGTEWAEFDSASNAIRVHIHPDNTSAANVAAAINKASDSGTIPPVSATVDPLDQTVFGKISGTSESDLGRGLIPLLPGKAVVFGTMQGGTGQSLDKTSGLQIVNGGKTHTIDLSPCKTVDDLLGVLNDPKYGLLATINSDTTGINVQSRISGTDFMIGENGGTTAQQLGIRTLTRDTFLSELDFNRGVMDYQGPGTNAFALYQSTTANSGLQLNAIAEGTDWNDYAVHFVPTKDPDGKVTIDWNKDEKTITIGINPGVTKACEVVSAFHEQPGPNQAFEMVLDSSLGINTGQGVVYDGQTITAGGANGGIDFTITRNDGAMLEIDVHSAKTIGDVINLINNHPKNVDGLLTAKLSENGNGIELVDHSIGSGTTRVDRAKLSTAAIDLGLVPRGEEFRLSNAGGVRASVHVRSTAENSDVLVVGHQSGAYANGVKIEFVDMNAQGGSGQPGFSWDANSQVLRFEIDPGATKAADIVKLFQDNANATLRQMFDFQNGVNPDGTTSSGSGLVELFPRPVDPTNPDAGTVPAPELTGGVDNQLIGSDPNPLETESVYTALIRLQLAMETDDTREIERATNLLDKTTKTVNSSRSEIGIRQNSLDTVQTRLEDEGVQLQQLLANSLQINLSDTIMGYSAALTSYEATLQVTSRMFQMSLMNYI